MNIEKNRVKEYLDLVGVNEPNKVLIIYLDGCQSCLSQHQELISKIVYRDDYKLVLVAKSPKKAKIIFGDTILKNAFFDSDLIALDYGLVTGFPMVYKFDELYNYIGATEIEYGSNFIDSL